MNVRSIEWNWNMPSDEKSSFLISSYIISDSFRFDEHEWCLWERKDRLQVAKNYFILSFCFVFSSLLFLLRLFPSFFPSCSFFFPSVTLSPSSLLLSFPSFHISLCIISLGSGVQKKPVHHWNTTWPVRTSLCTPEDIYLVSMVEMIGRYDNSAIHRKEAIIEINVFTLSSSLSWALISSK